MHKIFKPRKLMVCQTATGHKIRVISVNETTREAKVKSLATGLPFTTTVDDLQELPK
ncbi:hypothetical protein [Hymenobacter crusticola]|uniref:hypothetical protein n=1 Tax=Hymenobacter crusticola TaxID=1770526 RepID=UPI0015C51456|nr:hypothetical protein [Hymenobacter crusticola]